MKRPKRIMAEQAAQRRKQDDRADHRREPHQRSTVLRAGYVTLAAITDPNRYQ